MNLPNTPILRVCRWALFFVLAAGSSAMAESLGRWATLEAIHKLENPRNLSRPGRHGELGAYQFMPGTWRMHTQVPFSRAIDRSVSDVVAVKHYEWIKRNLEAAGFQATSYNIALAWNSGINAVIRGRSPQVSHDYAQRAVNLAASFPGTRTLADAR